MGGYPSTRDGLYEFGLGDPDTDEVVPVYVGKRKRRTRHGVVRRVNEYKNLDSSSISSHIASFIDENYDEMFVRYRYTDFPAGYEERLLMTFRFCDAWEGIYICNVKY